MTTARRTRRALAAAAVVLAALAAGVGDATVVSRRELQALARAVEREEDHVSPVQLARWIRDRAPGLRVVDVRTAEEYAGMHIPGAERIPLDRLLETALAPGERVVLYSEGGTHAAQGWVLLRAAGVRDVYVLQGGLAAWNAEVMEPVLPAVVHDAERAAWAERAALSRWFGGLPRRGDPAVAPAGLPATPSPAGDGQASGEERLRRARRRGC